MPAYTLKEARVPNQLELLQLITDTREMTPEAIRELVDNTPHTPPARGLMLYEHVRRTGASRCMELGFAHGVGTVWIGGAIQENGGGKLISVDLEGARHRRPDAPTLVGQAALQGIVELHFDPISYTWHLKRNLETYSREPFDFVFVDGSHSWDVDGFAFCLVDRVLKTGGWILFDDLNWTYSRSPTLANSPRHKGLTDEERDHPQIRAVWENLVLTHPAYGNFVEDGGWGWAQKTSGPTRRDLRVVRSYRVASPRRVIRKIFGSLVS